MTTTTRALLPPAEPPPPPSWPRCPPPGAPFQACAPKHSTLPPLRARDWPPASTTAATRSAPATASGEALRLCQDTQVTDRAGKDWIRPRAAAQATPTCSPLASHDAASGPSCRGDGCRRWQHARPRRHPTPLPPGGVDGCFASTGAPPRAAATSAAAQGAPIQRSRRWGRRRRRSRGCRRSKLGRCSACRGTSLGPRSRRRPAGRSYRTALCCRWWGVAATLKRRGREWATRGRGRRRHRLWRAGACCVAPRRHGPLLCLAPAFGSHCSSAKGTRPWSARGGLGRCQKTPDAAPMRPLERGDGCGCRGSIVFWTHASPTTCRWCCRGPTSCRPSRWGGSRTARGRRGGGWLAAAPWPGLGALCRSFRFVPRPRWSLTRPMSQPLSRRGLPPGGRGRRC